MSLLLSGGYVYQGGSFFEADILIEGGIISKIEPHLPTNRSKTIALYNFYIVPGFADAHVHLREPGFSYKETVRTGTTAAASAGYTAVCTMPNLNPVPDSPENLNVQTDIIEKDAAIAVYPYASITKGQKGEELVDFSALHDKVIAFSDDGKGVQSAELMEKAMTEAAKYGCIIAAHCEDNSLLNGGYIHDGKYARAYGHKGIPSESEYRQLKRDLALAKKTGCRYHVCHVSAKESVELIRKAKAEGVRVTAETAPHYLVLCEDDLQEDGRFKMNPPLRSAADRDALIEGIQDGTIDIIATDHAPHAAEEKAKGLAGSLMGVVGLETAFPVLYTKLVKTGVIPLEKLIALMSDGPRRIFGIGGGLAEGESADFAVLDLGRRYTIDPADFLSKGKSSPFAGMEVFGKNVMTFYKGKKIWQE
ncbi:MAG TPA: dihydroorotase [Bacillota bacterium]|mgnify:CR=1 FL=1|nr:dihydroorotase [Bacillota bacterium]HOK67916.1 dihydroorotase [Bacillota bacterium]HPP84307.1 dihydroorotase [Bacillota bacterium]